MTKSIHPPVKNCMLILGDKSVLIEEEIKAKANL
jgi:hypothetical protein